MERTLKISIVTLFITSAIFIVLYYQDFISYSRSCYKLQYDSYISKIRFLKIILPKDITHVFSPHLLSLFYFTILLIESLAIVWGNKKVTLALSFFVFFPIFALHNPLATSPKLEIFVSNFRVSFFALIIYSTLVLSVIFSNDLAHQTNNKEDIKNENEKITQGMRDTTK